MNAAVNLVKMLASAGVEFLTDGERIRWRNSNGRITPEVVATLAAEKATVIDFLTGKPQQEAAPAHPTNVVELRPDLRRNLKLDPVARPDDADQYAEALRLHGPASYGTMMRILGWGGTRAGQAETALRKAGRIAFNDNGRAYLVPGKESDR